jgi:processive 1,2-diacylglycerol beta-glucosyltransferase
VKKILILTASFGEGHNSAARGVRDGLARVAPGAQVELRDLFAEVYGQLNERIRKSYLALINRWPRSWGIVYRWLDRKTEFDKDFAKFSRLKEHLGRLLESFQPDAVVSTFPPYPYLLRQISLSPSCQNVVVVTDSITVNAIWYRAPGDYFLVPNEQSAEVVRAGGVPSEKVRIFGFPVSPAFADLARDRKLSLPPRQRVLYMINAGTGKAPETVARLLELDVHLTVTVGRDEKLRSAIEAVTGDRKSRLRRDYGGQVEIVGWTNQLPFILNQSDLLIAKAGGATVQETIAAGCPIIINHIVSGQEEGNARLIVETNSGAIAQSATDTVAQVQRAFADDASQWHEWAVNISKLSRPRASLDIANFLLSI